MSKTLRSSDSVQSGDDDPSPRTQVLSSMQGASDGPGL
jgi:hypothetical protein